MKKLFVLCLVASASFAFSGKSKLATLSVGSAAPEFSGVDHKGQTRKLSDYRGSYVVMEWLNHGCPFVKKHYNSGNMQKIQKKLTGEKVVWLSVISSAKGKQGFMTAEEAGRSISQKKAAMTAILLDPQGEIGRLYRAKTTPQMFLIDPKGKIVYSGAIDSKRSTDPDDIPSSKNYLLAAYTEAKAGKTVTDANTEPYGCSVKY